STLFPYTTLFRSKDNRVSRRWQRRQDHGLVVVSRLEESALDLSSLRTLFPVVVGGNQCALRPVEFEHGILENVRCRDTRADERRPQPAQHHRLGHIAADNES